MMDNHGDDDARTSAVKSKIQPMKPSDQEVATYEASAHCPYRDWCRACAGGAGRSDFHKRQREEQHGLLVASMDYGFFTDGQEPTPKGDSEIQGSHSVRSGESEAEHHDLEHACAMQRREGPGSNQGNCRIRQ